MKKLNLNVASLGATEILSREELKKVLGGTGTGTGSNPDFPGCADTKIKACDKKKENDSCCFLVNSLPSYGKCVSIYSKPLHCSDLK